MTLTPLALLGAAEEVLARGGYRSFERTRAQQTSVGAAHAREYEDEFGVVALDIFETVDRLLDQWSDAQADLVEVISEHISADEAKAWDGYLVLLSPELASTAQVEALNAIRYDTSRVRKLVASGADLTDTTDVYRVLSPLLPLDSDHDRLQLATLDGLPAVLAERGISPSLTNELVKAFEQQTPMIQAIAESVDGE